ncbi:MAG TPA: hypothetical protein VFG05_01865 [Methylocella sp.]|nr:hypothetical protein [Methylocella sp.]
MKKRLLKHAPAAGLGFGAGIAAAVLFTVGGRGTALAALLANLSPLPIMIAMLGFGLAAGIASVVSAAFIVAALFYMQQQFGHINAAALAGLAFALFLGLPSLWLSLLAVLSRAKGSPTWVVTTRVGSFFAREYCPLERILSYGASICASIGVAVAIYISSHYGGFNAAIERLTAELAPVIEGMMSANMQLPPGMTPQVLAKAMVLAAAPAAAGGSLLLLMLNLWLAGRVVQLSGQLPRPWPDIPRDLRLPQVYLLIFGAASIAGPYLGGLAGLIVITVAATLGIAFALDGLAVMHFLTRGAAYRIPLLTLIYVGLVVPFTWLIFLLLLAATGIIETAFSLRDRKSNPVRK